MLILYYTFKKASLINSEKKKEGGKIPSNVCILAHHFLYSAQVP